MGCFTKLVMEVSIKNKEINKNKQINYDFVAMTCKIVKANYFLVFFF